jgi:hypothetical protein
VIDRFRPLSLWERVRVRASPALVTAASLLMLLQTCGRGGSSPGY